MRSGHISHKFVRIGRNKFYIIPIIFFIASVVLIYHFKPESRERIENIPNISDIICYPVITNYTVEEYVNRTPRYLSNSSLKITFGGNTTTLVGKLNITNLENIHIRFFVNYTFNITLINKTRKLDKFYINTTISPRSYEVIPFYTYSERGIEANDYYVITVANYSIPENVTKSNITQQCL